MKIINTELLGHPLNWFVVGSMLAIWGYALHVGWSMHQTAPGSASNVATNKI